MSYKVIFFDWGGVIADDPGDDFLAALLEEAGASGEQKQEIFRTLMSLFMRGKISERQYWNTLKDRYNLAIPDSVSEKFKRWKGLVVNEDILATARKAQENGFKIAVLSNVIEPTYNVIQGSGYYDLFDEVIASCKVGFAKPDIGIYTLALRRLNVTASESIFIDDKQRCLDPAIALGFSTILARNPQQIITDLGKLIF